MTGAKLSVVALAKQLGISRQAVYKLHRAGMPLGSLEAARAWRATNLDPSRSIENPARRSQPGHWRSSTSSAPLPSAAEHPELLAELNLLVPRVVAEWRAAPHVEPPGGERLRDLLLSLSEEQFGDVFFPEDFLLGFLLRGSEHIFSG